MFPIDSTILLLGILVLVATLSSKLSSRAGLPLLVLFIGIGMLAGSEGLLGIEFTDFTLTHAVGTVALILILFDGGLQTSMDAIRRTAVPAGVLATLGVIVTAGLLGLSAWYFLDIPLAYGLLFGSIVGSTDAAAVFAALRSSGLSLRPRLASILEIESGSNDPMAVLLTIACLESIRGDLSGATDLALFLTRQIGIGVVVGWAVGRGLVPTINRIRLSATGLYPMLTLGGAFLSFGAAAALGGSGFLAAYITGIVLGNHKIALRRDLRRFHDGLAWLGQIGMFVILGLLSFPSQVREAWPQGLLLAAILMFVARPVTVALCLAPLRFDWREILFASWAGLRGAVPIILGIYPLLFAIDYAAAIFNLVFFVVLVSVSIQGWTLRPLARLLNVAIAAAPPPPVTVEVTSLHDVDADIVSYLVKPGARAANHRLDELGLPAEMAVALVERKGEMVVPRGSTVILPGDHVFVTLRPRLRWLVDHVFSPEGSSPILAQPVDGATTLAELQARHGLPLPGDPEMTLAAFLQQHLQRPATRGDEVELGMLRFTILDTDRNGTIRDVRLDLAAIPRADEAPAPPAK